MATAESRKHLFLRKRSTSPKVFATRQQQIIRKNKLQVQTTKQIQKTVPKVVSNGVNYNKAWETALAHFDKGKAGAYLYHMQREATGDPQIGAIYAYVKELARQQRSGNIYPASSKLAKERIRIQQTPTVDFSKVKTGKITYSPEFNTYYTRSKSGKLIVTSGIRGFDYLTEAIKTDGDFKKPSSSFRLPDRKIPGFATVPAESQLIASKVKITKSNVPGKVVVRFPNGQIVTINSKGRSVVGERLAGNQYVFKDGVIRKIDGKDIFEEKLKPIKISKRDEIIKWEKLKDISNKYQQEILTTTAILTNANRKKDLDKLKDLYSLGTNRTSSQNLELKRLEKDTAKNYKLASELIGKTIAVSLINIGVGSKELIAALNENPEETLKALPPAIYAGVVADFNRVMSGDPLEIGKLGLEYYTLGRVFRMLGGAVKKGVKTSFGIGRTLAPKYLAPVATKLRIAPIKISRVAIKTATGRKVAKAVNIALKKTGVKNKVARFNKTLKSKKQLVERKLQNIKNKAAKVRVKQKKVVAEVKKSIDYADSIRKANKLRTKNHNFWMLQWRKQSFKSSNAIHQLEVVARDLGKIKALTFLKNKASRGRILSDSQKKIFIQNISESYIKAMRKTQNYKMLKKIVLENRNLYIKIPKPHKMALNLVKKIINRLEKTKLVKIINSSWDKAIKNALKPIKKIKSAITVIKAVRGKVAKKFKSELEYGRQLRRARKRKAIRKSLKITKFKSVDTNYIRAVDFMYSLSDSFAIARVIKYLNFVKRKGLGKGLGKIQQIELKANLKKKAIAYSRQNLERLPDFIKLKKLAKMNNPYAKELLAARRIKPARFYLKLTHVKLNKLKTKITREFEKIRSNINKRKIRKERVVKFEKLKAGKLEKYLKSNRYLMDVRVAKKIKVLTPGQLIKTRTIKQYTKIVDELFSELSKRTKINITTLQYRQLKNSIKRNLKKAVKRGDKKILLDFKKATNKIITELSYPNKHPTIRVVRSIKVKAPKAKVSKLRKVFHIIEDFKPRTPKGQYKEVKIGNKILLRKRKKVKLKKIKVQQQIQILKVVQVTKKKISLLPLVKFSTKALATVAAKSAKTRQIFSQVPLKKQLPGLLQDSAQDFVSLTKIGKVMTPKFKVTKVFAKLFNESLKKKKISRIKTKQVTKKKPILVPKFKKSKNTRKLPRKVMTYGFVIRKKGKAVRLKIPPMTLKDAWDVGSKKLDFDLQRTGRLIPLGKTDIVAKLAKGVSGYYKRNSKKFRRFRRKKGKIITLERTIIEKKKYIGDKKSEIMALRRKAKKTIRKKRTIKRPMKKKQIKRRKKKR